MTENLSPMMRQYMETKKKYNDCILFYRLGDFYEMFFDDAIKVSRELELTLTGKQCGLKERAPMCGIPFHSANVYIAKLVEKGYKIAICEQVEDPKSAKGLVKRRVIKIVTPGTVTDEKLLNEKNNNYLAVINADKSKIGMAFADVSTGELYAAETDDEDEVLNEIARYSPAEILINSSMSKSLSDAVSKRFAIELSVKSDIYCTESEAEQNIKNHFKTNDLKSLKIDNKSRAVTATGVMLKYLLETQMSGLDYIDKLNVYDVSQYMGLDVSARRNLEITQTMRDKSKKGSLLWVLDRTKTSMGARKLRQWLEKPLIDRIQITKRLDSVNELVKNVMLRDDIRDVLGGIYDISRIISRITLGTISPKDLTALRESITHLPVFAEEMSNTKSSLLKDLYADIDVMDDVGRLLTNAINDEVPATIKDGGIIKSGYNKEIDELRDAMKNGKNWLTSYLEEEKNRTGIKNLKIAYNKVFGYFIEVTKSNLDMVPDDYIRKQTLTNCERFITPKLKELENTMIGASERVIILEGVIFNEIRAYLNEQLFRLKKVAEVIAVTDVLCSLAEVAGKNNYCMPDITDNGRLDIKEGRHPVVEKMLYDTVFVPNDTVMNKDDDRMLIITGPNMAGKSTYMRQTALIVLMAQIGSFVPAKSATIGIVDKIFTRVGAADDITLGQSTFMMEMAEVSNILQNATSNSLIILDEVGRGTSTFDGLSIAWAVAEYIHNKKKIGAKTLFATHYHEMTQLEKDMEGIKNYHVAVKKSGDDITFLRKIVRGGTDDSYGIQVAAIAGVPPEVIRRAKKILKELEDDNPEYKEITPVLQEKDDDMQISFSDKISDEITEELKRTDVTTLTPIEAMNLLFKLSKKAQNA